MKAMEATIFLPDSLFEESLGDTGETKSSEMQEYTPSTLYIEQVLRILPREYTSRLRMGPAFEETLMKYDESKGGTGGAKGSNSPQGSTKTPGE